MLVTTRNAGIAITPVMTLGFFTPQGQHCPPIIIKFAKAEGTTLLGHMGILGIDPEDIKIPNFANLLGKYFAQYS